MQLIPVLVSISAGTLIPEICTRMFAVFLLLTWICIKVMFTCFDGGSFSWDK